MQTKQKKQSPELERMIAEVKRRLKPESKNELIRIIAALLLDNYALKSELESIMSKIQEHNKKVDEINEQIKQSVEGQALTQSGAQDQAENEESNETNQG